MRSSCEQKKYNSASKAKDRFNLPIYKYGYKKKLSKADLVLLFVPPSSFVVEQTDLAS